MKGKLLTMGVISLLAGLLISCAAPAPATAPPPAPPATTAPLATVAPPPPTAISQVFPRGAFDVKPYQGIQGTTAVPKKLVYTFKDDGTYTLAGHGFALGSGKATVTGDQIALVGKFLDGSCADQEGVYKWSSDDRSLNLTVVQDPCEDRRTGLTGGLTRRAETVAAPVTIGKLPNIGTTKSLTILPLIDLKGLESFKAEGGVSYLIKTDDATVLLDMGANRKNEDPSPFQANMQQLGIKWSDITAIAFSHQHYDHTGGLKWQFTDTFAPGLQQIDLGGKPVYVPAQLTYPGLTPIVATQPMKIAKAVASIGTLPMTPPGDGPEQILAVNIEGKGIVLITGCGHPTIPKIVERARLVFDAPIVGIIGGLHYPEKDAKLIQERIDFLKGLNLQIVALSPHDSSEEAQTAVREAFGATAKEIKVGQPIVFGQ
jgi:7,8-dihydropterin-6-yl-methyl-4-(beta-D-ribofuranosyl)aminobenzene 5'-phosphate synthase